MTTSSSPIQQAIQAISDRGWAVKSLSRSSYPNTQRPWFCQLYPAHFGSHFQGTKTKMGGYTVYVNAMTLVIGDGDTAIEAMTNAINALDKSYLKGVYESLERAFMDNLNALQARNSRREKNRRSGSQTRLEGA